MTEKRPRSQVIVRFQDSDLLGHLNNVHYIQYFINAREDHLRTYYAFDPYKHSREHQENWVITRHQIAYLRPAFPGERVTIETGLIHLDDTGVTVEGIMTDETGAQLKALQRTTFRYVNVRSGRPARHTPELMAFLALLLREDVAVDDMDLRIQQIKQELRAQPLRVAS